MRIMDAGSTEQGLGADVEGPDPGAAAALLRRFNRHYTRELGVLSSHLLDSDCSLPESRVLWELAQPGVHSATALTQALRLDPGYMSRLLRRLRQRGYIDASPVAADRRRSALSLTDAGRAVLAQLETSSQRQMQAVLDRLDDSERQALLQAADTVMRLTGGSPPAAIVLRRHRPGDIGWIVSRHGALYAAEQGYGPSFEATVARIGAEFLERNDPVHEACWIAERSGHALGAVMLVQARDAAGQAEPGVAQLRVLIVEPAGRGHGVGAQLVQACEDFARQAGYRAIRLWTHRGLDPARRLYARAGYRRQDDVTEGGGAGVAVQGAESEAWLKVL